MPSASAAFATCIRAVTVGEPITWHGLTVFPLLATEPRAPEYDMFGFARDAGGFQLTEVSEGGIVGQLRAQNARERPVLLLDGEEVTGAKQNRIINLTILVPAHATLDIPVSCVEQGRWSLKSKAFSDTGRTMFARGRARKMRDVTASLRTRGSAEADQGAVWEAVAEELHAADAVSGTAAMSAIFEKKAGDVESFVAAFAPLPLQVGAVFGVGGTVAGAELFDSHQAYAASAAKIVRGYGIELRAAAMGAPVTEQAAVDFLDRLCATTPTEHATAGAGRQLRVDDAGIIGAALVHDDRVIHLTAFRSDDHQPSDDNGNGGPTRRARAMIRDGVMRCSDADIFDRTPSPITGDARILRDRVEGMLIALAIGDSLGNTSEGLTPQQRRALHGEIRGYLPSRHAFGRRVGVPSDETQLAFCTLRQLLHDGALEPDRLASDFCHQRIFGIGHSMLGFIRAHKDQRRPWTESGQPSAGNGALARMAPVLLPHLRSPTPALWDDAAIAGMITHNEPAAIAACVAFVEVLWQSLSLTAAPGRGWWLGTFLDAMAGIEGDVARYRPRAPRLQGATSLAAFTERHVSDALGRDSDTLTACDGWYSGAFLLETVPSVLYILERHAHDPEEAIIRAVNDTKDNDTIAAIVGAAVGALHGRSALPHRWVDGLLGRTGERDDGAVFGMVELASRRFVDR
jgi:ADP-ribosyl-[dinitrogen reductase] hydrolase